MASPSGRKGGSEDLKRYWAKRNFRVTPEPRGAVAKGSHNRFVVQKHAARRLHYDFRLELAGTLKSWALAKGPSLDPRDKRLAVHVEDHPLDYADFEGIIPEGEYGGGTVMVWDRGTWEPIGDPMEGYSAGHLKFELHGEKLKGRWVLVRMGGRARSERRDNWLLIKERDQAARPGDGTSLLDKEDRSVATGRSMEEIAASGDRVWTARGGRTRESAKARKPAARAAETRMSRKNRAAKPHRLSDFVPPELPTLVDRPPEGAEWLHEIKLDGYRMLCRVERGRVHFLTRTGQDWTDRFPALAKSRLDVDSALIDGEIVAVDKNGGSNFQALQEALSNGQAKALRFFAFDLLHLNGTDLRSAGLEVRKVRLKGLLDRNREGAPDFVLNEHIDGRGAKVFENACHLSLEGIVSKRRNSPYRPGRSTDWVKTKCGARQEFVIGGFTEHAKEKRSIGALLIGYYEDGDFRYAGRVGTGFTSTSRRALRRQLEPLRRRTAPFQLTTSATRRGAIWVEPRLVAEIAYSNWTRDGVLRHPSFQGLRADKPANAVSREKVKSVSDATTPRRSAQASRTVTVAGIVLTHPDRVLYESQGLTKRDLAEYYATVADAMLPHVEGRPLGLVRCPVGQGKSCFYQKHPGASAPKALRRVQIREKSGTDEYLVVDDVAGLIALVQMGVLEVHPWGSRAEDVERPDRIIFDLDPAPDVSWTRVVDAAAALRDRLKELGLESFLKTTGGKGLHVVAPLKPDRHWPEVKAFCKAVVTAMERDVPDAYTTIMSKRERDGRIFLDYLRNDRGATAIAPFSTRARPGAPVAMPLSWRELGPDLDPQEYNVLTVPGRLKARKSDPWSEMLKSRQKISAKALAAVGMK